MKNEKNKFRNLMIAVLAICLLQSGIVRAAFGDLDTSFSGDGMFTDPYAYNPEDIARQSDGKILVTGWAGPDSGLHFVLRRYNANGTVDNGFGWNGNAVPYNIVGWYRRFIVQGDGKIVVVGRACDYNCTAIWRFNSDGSYDSGFGSFGRVSFSGLDASDVAGYKPTRSSPQNLFVIANNRLYRFGSTGGLVTSFGNGGSIELPFGYRMTIRQSSIYVTGTPGAEVKIAKYSAVDGSIDTSFGTLGVYSYSAFQNCGGSLPDNQTLNYEKYESIGFQSDGKIIAGGYFLAGNTQLIFYYSLLNRHQPNGDLDPGFAPTCGYSMPTPQGFIDTMKVLPDDRILFGDQWAYKMFRLTADGAPDGEFNTSTPARDFIVQPDGKIVVVGPVSQTSGIYARLARYLP